MLRVEPIRKCDAVARLGEEEKCNVCNLGERPADYQARLEATYTHHWVDAFRDHYEKVTLPPRAVATLLAASAAGKLTGRAPLSYNEDLDDIAATLPLSALLSSAAGAFVRTESVSLKTGMHGAGPYRDYKSILESMVTAIVQHSPLHAGQGVTLYLFPWLTLDLEFRVFVHSGTVTGVSQQHWYTVDERYCAFVPRLLELVEFVQCHCVPRLPAALATHGCTLDIATLASDGSFYFIEPNGFGAPYSAGSSLFHWLQHDLTQPQSYRYLVAD